MRGGVAVRLDRLAVRNEADDQEQLVRELAAEHGLSVAEVRAEWDDILRQQRRHGPCSPEEAVRRCADRFGLPEAEVWTEYRAIAAGDRA